MVRDELAVPFHRGFIEHPTAEGRVLHGREKKTIGGWISRIHDAIRDDAVHSRLMEFVGASCSHS